MEDGDEYHAKLYLNPLKSGKAVIRSFVTFINDSDRSVDVYWVNYSGQHIHYSCLKQKGDSTKVNTYETHPWISKCSRTGERMDISGSSILFPKAWYKCLHGGPSEMTIKRQEVNVHFPLKTLKNVCEQKIVKMLSEEESINILELPKILEKDLLEVYREHKSYLPRL